MEFDEESMNVFRQAVDDFIAAGESASFELAGRVLAAARIAVDAAEDFQDEVDELDEEGLAEVEKLAREFLSSKAGVQDWEFSRRMKRAMHWALTGLYDDEDEMVENLQQTRLHDCFIQSGVLFCFRILISDRVSTVPRIAMDAQCSF